MSIVTKLGWIAFLIIMVAILLSCGMVFVPWIYNVFKFIWEEMHWMFVAAIAAVGSVFLGLFIYALDYAFKEAGKYPPP